MSAEAFIIGTISVGSGVLLLGNLAHALWSGKKRISASLKKARLEAAREQQAAATKQEANREQAKAERTSFTILEQTTAVVHGHVHVRRSDLRRNTRLKLTFAIFRFCLYGMVGLSSGIFFYNLVRIARHVPILEFLFRFQWRVDDRLPLNDIWDTPAVAAYGQSSLWMFLIYGMACFYFIEPIYRRTFRQHVMLRAVLYGNAILIFEGLSGLLLEKLTGYRIWYYADSGAILWEMTSLYILPVWMVTGLIAELIYRELMDPALVAILEFTTPLARTVPLPQSGLTEGRRA